jgi:hypothetical protein
MRAEAMRLTLSPAGIGYRPRSALSRGFTEAVGYSDKLDAFARRSQPPLSDGQVTRRLRVRRRPS